MSEEETRFEWTKDLMEINEVARMLSVASTKNVSYDRVYHYIRNAHIPTVKKGNKVYVRFEELREMPITVSIDFLISLFQAARERGQSDARKEVTKQPEQRQPEQPTSQEGGDETFTRLTRGIFATPLEDGAEGISGFDDDRTTG